MPHEHERSPSKLIIAGNRSSTHTLDGLRIREQLLVDALAQSRKFFILNEREQMRRAIEARHKRMLQVTVKDAQELVQANARKANTIVEERFLYAAAHAAELSPMYLMWRAFSEKELRIICRQARDIYASGATPVVKGTMI